MRTVGFFAGIGLALAMIPLGIFIVLLLVVGVLRGYWLPMAAFLTLVLVIIIVPIVEKMINKHYDRKAVKKALSEQLKAGGKEL